MSDNLNKAQVMQSLDELEDLLSKAQIVRGGNSERREWAGSSWEDEGIPENTPNGTDYVPPKKVARKAMDQMPVEEIERYLEMRKSGAPNPIAAENEILQTVPGVEKAICPKCEGTQRDALTKSQCEKCNGFGFVWCVPTKEGASMIKSIEAKWNVSKAVQPPHGKNTGGGAEGADTTPADGNVAGSEQKPETVTSTPNPSVKKALEKAKKAVNDMMAAEEEEEETPPEEGKEEESLEEILGGKGKCAGGKAKKSLDNEVLSRVLGVVLKSLTHFSDRLDQVGGAIDDLYSVQSEQADLVNGMAKSFMDVKKSLEDVPAEAPQNGTRPAHGGKAVTSNVQILQKGFVDAAPGSEENGMKYDFITLKKGASKMVIAGKLDKRIGLRMDTGELPGEKIVKSIEAYIDENGID